MFSCLEYQGACLCLKAQFEQCTPPLTLGTETTVVPGFIPVGLKYGPPLFRSDSEKRLQLLWVYVNLRLLWSEDCCKAQLCLCWALRCATSVLVCCG